MHRAERLTSTSHLVRCSHAMHRLHRSAFLDLQQTASLTSAGGDTAHSKASCAHVHWQQAELQHCCAAVTTAAADGICRQKASWGAAERVFAQPPKLSKSDSDFARDGLELMHGAEVPVGELNELFAKVCTQP